MMSKLMTPTHELEKAIIGARVGDMFVFDEPDKKCIVSAVSKTPWLVHDGRAVMNVTADFETDDGACISVSCQRVCKTGLA